MLFSKAIEGFILDGLAGSYSPHTMRLYQLYLDIYQRNQGDCELEAITPSMLSCYMSYLRNDYKPHRPSKDSSPLSPSALDNHWKCLRAFFKWCNRTFDLKRPDLHLPRQKYQLPEIIPFTEEEVRALVDACEYTKAAATSKRKSFRMKRPTSSRDKALVLLLLDTGLRVGEVTRLHVQDVNLETGEIHVKPYGSGQKTKPRTVYLGKASRRAMWLHLLGREAQELLFHLTPNNIRLLLFRLGTRVGVSNVHPHRFRCH